MRTLIILSFLFCPFAAKTQIHDNTWLLGYQSGPVEPGDSYGITILRFENGTVSIEDNAISSISYYGNNSAFSDSSGSLITYFNGLQIDDRYYHLMQNGNDMDKEISLYQNYSDDSSPQGSIFLPWPDHPDSILLIYAGDLFIPGFGTSNRNLSYAVIDRKANNGLGKVVAREQPIIEDTIVKGQLTAVKHANGRDWWMVIHEENTNRFYQILIDPQGVHVLGQQVVDFSILDGLGQSCYSPDGVFFISYNAISSTVGAWLDVFEFDRCEGLLFNQKHVYYAPGNGRIGGVSISPNSRFLYHNFYDTVYQYDLYATNFEASRKTVAIRDSTPFPFRFFLSQLAPDGKIYTCATNGMKSLHVIHRPDEVGMDCQYQKRGMELSTINSSSVTNFPNYRLGPLDGSVCDTLGLDNLPIAWFRYEQDTLNPNIFEFRDLSYYEPATWSWDFGDGASSTERHPIHTYTNSGSYQVCLTVGNDNGSNTHCKTVQLTVSAAQPAWVESIKVSPSPFRERLIVSLDTNLPSPVFRLFDAMGRILITQPVFTGLNEMDTAALPPGFYVWEVAIGKERIKTGKAIKMGE